MSWQMPELTGAGFVISAHLKRWLTAAVAVPLLILIVFEGGNACFALFVGLTAALGLLEYYALVFPGKAVAGKWVGLILGLAVILSFCTGNTITICGMLALVFLGSAIMCLARFKPGASVSEVLSRQVMGFIYIPFLLGHLILIRDWNNGIIWTCFLLIVVFAGDTGAYYVGKAFGRHKLAPGVSPGKTVEGAGGGLAANLLVGSLFKTCWLPEIAWGLCLALIVLVGILGQAGDLVESMLKRSIGLKDSGGFFPGHGGVLDRIDSLLFAAPVVYYFKMYLL